MDTRKISAALLYQQTDGKTGGQFSLKTRERAKLPFTEAADEASKNSKEMFSGMAPMLTSDAIQLGGMIGALLLPGSMIFDLVKFPIGFIVGTEEAARSVITRVAGYLFEKEPNSALTHRLFESFLLRFRCVLSLLVSLKYETKEDLDKRLQSGDIADLVGLTFLLTAYHSRNTYSLMLANGKAFAREDCPPEGLVIYDQLVLLRDKIKKAVQPDFPNPYYDLKCDDREKAEAEIALKWFDLVRTGKTITAADDATLSDLQISVVNHCIQLIQDIKTNAMHLLTAVEPNVVEKIAKLKR